MSRSSEIRVAVVGVGSWGTTVAAPARVNTPTVRWARRSELVDQIDSARVDSDHLPSRRLPDQLRATDSIEEVAADADVLVTAVRSHGFREVADAAPTHLRPWVPVVRFSKGLERALMSRSSESELDRA